MFFRLCSQPSLWCDRPNRLNTSHSIKYNSVSSWCFQIVHFIRLPITIAKGFGAKKCKSINWPLKNFPAKYTHTHTHWIDWMKCWVSHLLGYKNRLCGVIWVEAIKCAQLVGMCKNLLFFSYYRNLSMRKWLILRNILENWMLLLTIISIWH